MSIADSDRDAHEKANYHQNELSIGGDLEAIRSREEALLSELDEPKDDPSPVKGVAPELRATIKAAREQVAVDNLAKKEQRDERRRAARRASPQYQAELKEARDIYEARILTEEGREVRNYTKVPGKTREEREENAKARDAARKRDERANATQAEKDKENDRKWVARQRKKNVPEEQIAEGLEKRAADRVHRQPEPSAYEDNPDFGAF